MLPIKTIVCPTDFSEASFEALKAANELAVEYQAEFYVVYVVPPMPAAPPMAQIPPSVTREVLDLDKYKVELMKASEKALSEVLEAQTTVDLGLHPLVLEGNVADRIVEAADEHNADLIVMGSHGETGFRRVVFGSVAEKVVRLAKRPVLVVPPADKD